MNFVNKETHGFFYLTEVLHTAVTYVWSLVPTL